MNRTQVVIIWLVKWNTDKKTWKNWHPDPVKTLKSLDFIFVQKDSFEVGENDSRNSFGYGRMKADYMFSLITKSYLGYFPLSNLGTEIIHVVFLPELFTSLLRKQLLKSDFYLRRDSNDWGGFLFFLMIICDYSFIITFN